MSDDAIEVVGEVLPAVNKGGRPTLLTPELQKRIVAATHAGAYSWTAAASAGIAPQTFQRWMMHGKKEAEDAEEAGRTPNTLGLFYIAVTQARGVARVAAEVAVKKENPLAWLLKGPGRERPGEPGWADSNKVELSGPNGGPINLSAAPVHDLSLLTAEELDALDALTSKALAPRT